MKITYQDRVYDLDKEAIGIDEWRELKRKYKMTPKQFDESIGEADPDASTFLYWVMLRQDGDRRTPLNDELKPDIIALNAAVAAAIEDEPEVEADPTTAASRPDGVTPPGSGSTTGTSTGSATSTSSPSPKSADSEPVRSGD